MRRTLAAVGAALSCLAAASDPAERLKDPAQEARARALFANFRCVVCQNESIDESNAELAKDLRRIVRRQVAEGRSEAEIRTFMVQRYGEFILLKPTFSPGNALLWLTPVLVVGLGGAYLLFQAGRRRAGEDALTPEEEAELAALTASDSVTVPPQIGATHEGASAKAGEKTIGSPDQQS